MDAVTCDGDVQELAGTLKVLSDPTRLRIFCLLMRGTHCNCEISRKLGLALNLISHHLRALRNVGLVEGMRDPEDERWVYYSINPERVQQLEGMLRRLLDVSCCQPRVTDCGPRKGYCTTG